MTVEINGCNTKIRSYRVSCNSTKCKRTLIGVQHLQFVNKSLGFSVGHKPKILNTIIQLPKSKYINLGYINPSTYACHETWWVFSTTPAQTLPGILS